MARKVFFSFHFERDCWRAGQVRNSWVAKPGREEAGFWDTASWEKIKKQNDDAIKQWIDNQLNGTSVTAVLIGAETSQREWVRYEIIKSRERGNGILGIYIHNIKDQFGLRDKPGDNYFGEIDKGFLGKSTYFWQEYPTYDWVINEGHTHLGNWIEQAARKAGKEPILGLPILNDFGFGNPSPSRGFL